MTKRFLVTSVVAFISSLALGVSPAAAKVHVIVDNAPSQAVPTIATVNQPIQVNAGGSLNGPSNFVLYTVPAGKRLVVEHFSSEVGVAPTTTVNRFGLGIINPSSPGSFRFSHFIAPAFSSPCGTCASNEVEVVASQPIHMYVEAGEDLVVNVTFSGPVGPDAFGFFSASGYLIDTP